MKELRRSEGRGLRADLASRGGAVMHIIQEEDVYAMEVNSVR